MAAPKPQSTDLKRHGTTSTADAKGSNSDSLEQYGVWVKAGPVDVDQPEDELSNLGMEDLEVPDEGDSEAAALTEEEEKLLGSLEEDTDATFDIAADDLSIDSVDDISDIDMPVEDTDLPDLGDDPFAEIEGVAEDGETGHIDTASELSVSEDESMDIPEGSAAILQKIEDDLTSIKKELLALKNEIFSLRGTSHREESSDRKEEAESGFFAEDEDETIALTGDELDNILNTADITEQTGQSTASPEDADLMMDDMSGNDQSLMDRDDVINLDEPDIEDLSDSAASDDNEVDLASITEEPTEELTLEEPGTGLGDDDVLDLPEEEEIVLEEIGDDSLADDSSELGADELQIDFSDDDIKSPAGNDAEEMSFDLDEELELSPSEEQDLASTQDFTADSEVPDIDELDLGDDTADENDAIDLSAEEIEPPILEKPKSAPQQKPFGKNGAPKIPDDLKSEIRAILKYMDQLLESLPEDKIEEFAKSEYFDTYKRLFEELGLTT